MFAEILFGKVPDVRRRLKAQNLSADDLRLLTDMEQEGENRKTMLKLLGQLLRRVEKNTKKKKSSKRSKDRHTNPNKDRHVPKTNHETGTFRDFLWSNRHESASLAALCFAEEARSIGLDEADLNSADDVDVLDIVRKFQSFITKRSGAKVCGVCGVAGLEGRGTRIKLDQFNAWIVRPESEHDDSMAATLRREINDSDSPESKEDYLIWRKHLHLHLHTVKGKDVEYILCSRGVTGEYVDVCSRCESRTATIRELSRDREVYLSRFAEKRQNVSAEVSIMPAPECSFTQFDPGKTLEAGRHLSTLEKIALAEFIVAGNVHKVRNARDVVAAFRLSGHTIVFPIDSLGSVATRTLALPRTDVADQQRIMWSGTEGSYAKCHSQILNLRRLQMRYSEVVDALKMLKIMHPRYKEVEIAGKDEIKWEEQKQSVFKDIIIRPDGKREAHESSDIAKGWEPGSRTKQSKGSPCDADFATVMVLGKDSMKPSPLLAVQEVCKAVVEAKRSTKTTIEVGEVPVNEYKEFATLLSGAFPVEFPLGIRDDDLGGGGGLISKKHLHRLVRFYDGRVAKNETLLMYLCNAISRHRSQSNVTARVRKDSAAKLVELANSEKFQHDSAIAEKDPESEEAKELVKQISPLVQLAGGKVPWSPLERLSATHHMYALYHTFGPPAFFVTFAPKTLTNELVLTFGLIQGDPGDTTDLRLPENLQHR